TIESATPLQAAHSVVVRGGANLVTGEDAVNIALAQTLTQWWLAAHSAQAVTRVDEEGHWVLFKDRWTRVDEAVFDQVLSETREPSVFQDLNDWVVRWTTPYGFAPRGIEVRVSILTGSVISVRPVVD